MKRYLSVCLSLLISILVWLLSNLSETATLIVSVPMVAHSNIVGHSDTSVDSAPVTALVSGSGFSLVGLKMRSRRTVHVNIDPNDIHTREGDFFTISSNALLRYSHELFGNSVTVQSFITENLRLRFKAEIYKTVPVVPITVFSYKSQYMAYGELQFSPDSVKVYGDPHRLESVDCVYTDPVSQVNIDQNVQGVVHIDAPAGLRLSDSSVKYSQDVVRYVEVVSKAPVNVRNVPQGHNLTPFPSTVDVTYRLVFPVSGNPASVISFYVDYEDFTSSIGGKCVVKAERVPDSVIALDIYPPACDCIENVHNR